MKKILPTAFIAISLFSAKAYSQTIRYVSATGTGNGSSWAQASGDLQSMIDASLSGDQVWVAAGLYHPIRKGTDTAIIAPGDRDNTFVLRQGVTVYGSFAGTETTLAERSVAGLVTGGAGMSVLSGDFNDNDVVTGKGSTLTFSNNEENAYHVVVAGNLTSNNSAPETVLDGFVIKGGNGNDITTNIIINGIYTNRGSGAGIFAGIGNITFNKIILINNWGQFTGGMYCAGSASTIKLTNSVVSHNYSNNTGGGGVFNLSANLIIANVMFTDNNAVSAGAIRNHESGTATLTNVTMVNNHAGSLTGGIYNAGTLQVRNSILYGNSKEGTTGGPNVANVGSLTFTNSLVQGSGGSSAWHLGVPSIDEFGIDGGNNIDAVPLFTDAAANDFSLLYESPGINAGTNAVYANGATPNLTGITTDITGSQRICEGVVDMGAFEFFVPCNLEAPVLQDVTLCNAATVADYMPEGYTVLLYADDTAETPLQPTDMLTSDIYYVSQTEPGCESPRTAVAIDIITVSTEVTLSENTLTATQEGATYQWMRCDNEMPTPIEGATGQSFTPTVSGSYFVTVSIGVCMLTSECNAVEVLATNEHTLQNVSVYPIPAQGTVNISMKQEADYQMYNVLGAVVKAGKLTSGTSAVDISNLQSGIYMLKLYNQSGERVVKIVKE